MCEGWGLLKLEDIGENSSSSFFWQIIFKIQRFVESWNYNYNSHDGQIKGISWTCRKSNLCHPKLVFEILNILIPFIIFTKFI